MSPLKNIKKLRGLQGRLAYIQRFISNLSGCCQSFSKLMKKGVSFVWDGDCQKAFEEIKKYFTQPPILVAPISGKPFLLYVRAIDHSLGALLAQNNDQGQKQVIYYLSRTMIGAEHHKSFESPDDEPIISELSVGKMEILLSQYDMQFMPQKAVKGQALANFLADHPVLGTSKLYEELPDEVAEACVTQEIMQVWKLFFDGASRANPHGAITTGVRVVLVSPNGHVIPRGFSLIEPCTNNVAEYNTLLLGMQFVEELNIRHLEAYVLKQAKKFKGFFIGYILRAQNAYADALASLATSLALPPGSKP
ncbi:uncharacterized protein LOC109847707 [Asparagus officinalis]|uniref:uncharacterized protein LOC109847707 n=1 Tax=Asparagus officinalis TaxID=4686 RepID=UPI00098E3F06|nr:uncharacterized protein LOC109847707 [Asparagus officinalis]